MALSNQGEGGETEQGFVSMSFPRVVSIDLQIWVSESWETKKNKKSEFYDFIISELKTKLKA